MTLYERIDELAKKQKISVFDLSLKLGMGRNAIYQWKKSVPNVEAVQKVADYFDVSVDYLLDRDDNKSPKNDLDTKLERMMDNAMSYDGKPISDEDRPIIKGILKAYFDNKK
ncbi:helix-turn-helix transcriptional regulator [Enterococcus cecorum]|uniref:Helix-turn-helix transcriptional regulator n=1 Tax=Enterococcus cecorum TaxID=44008 RepID=A0AAW9JKI0_9ENTE|nr:helix-turn-helix transcriptional regulator [Enterococcus cecorum]MCJ0572001.1 helix-turn-helix domain-containing protein [Enterococcus cecorum]MCJ0590984.1 helix-turn-helix domain-containing protein [Enterococcus cecorum]MDZ5504161.1 helix-turn-helix transcriptional regulator [Enterococcus cecorum]MDZ5531623.1 helix-turn-helix transcriptional regulator [Enterococcus cecorum]MDZ5544999.1 helix-turn-helix transcriptional regulator [Enterococcus cecorum]